MKSSIRLGIAAAVAIGATLLAPSARAIVIYGNGATFGPDDVYKWDVDVTAGTSVMLDTYLDVTGTGGANGRGVVIVGNTMYTTNAGTSFEGDNKIYMTDVTTKASLGSITVSGIPGTVNLSTLAWDGSQFWSSQYIGGGDAYRIDLTGAVTKTITLGSYSTKDGMEYFEGKLIANRGDTVGPYDVYDLDGNLLDDVFINTFGTTGIAYDGTYFFTVSGFTSLNVWDSAGTFVKNIALAGSFNSIEDLSVDYAQRSDTGGGGVPDGGATVTLLGLALLGGASFRRFLAGA